MCVPGAVTGQGHNSEQDRHPAISAEQGRKQEESKQVYKGSLREATSYQERITGYPLGLMVREGLKEHL